MAAWSELQDYRMTYPLDDQAVNMEERYLVLARDYEDDLKSNWSPRVSMTMDTNLYRWHEARPDCTGVFTYEGERPSACPNCGIGRDGDTR